MKTAEKEISEHAPVGQPEKPDPFAETNAMAAAYLAVRDLSVLEQDRALDWLKERLRDERRARNGDEPPF